MPDFTFVAPKIQILQRLAISHTEDGTFGNQNHYLSSETSQTIPFNFPPTMSVTRELSSLYVYGRRKKPWPVDR